MNSERRRASACLRFGATAALLGLSGAAVEAQGPGDTQILKAVHPGYTLTNIRPAAIAEGVSGMDFLSDGRLVICTWNGNHDPIMAPVRKGNAYVLSNVDQDDATKITYKLFAANLQEPMGLKVVDDVVYVTERQALLQLTDANKDGVADSSVANAATAGYKPVASYASGDKRHEYFFGLLYKNGTFYGAHSLSLNNGGTAAVPQPNPNRGTFIKVNRTSGATEYIAGGAREPFGIGWGPEGELFATDVQGTWLPASKLNHVEPGAFYGHYQKNQVPASPYDAKPFHPPAVWLPQSEIANAPGNPVLVPSGPFEGQMLYGDVYYGGIQRVYLEKVGSVWQGAVMRFSAGFEGGVGRLVFGPDGSLYVGQIGHNTGNWFEPGKKTYGLSRLKANGKGAFEILRVVSRPKGMELEFTEPVGAGFDDPAKFTVKTWYYAPTEAYGGDKKEPKTLAAKSATVDASGRKVYLEIDGLETGRVTYIRVLGLKSKAGASMWSTEAWYTLNAFGTGKPFDPVVAVGPAPGKAKAFAVRAAQGNLSITLPYEGDFAVDLLDARGAVVSRKSVRGLSGAEVSLPVAGLPRGVYAVRMSGPGGVSAKRVILP